MNVADRRILLTGATGGIGGALARRLARAGADLLLTGRDAQRLEALGGTLESEGGTVRTVAADLATPGGRSSVAAAAAAFDVDTLVNNAGSNAFGLFADQGSDEIERLLAANIAAPILLTRSLLPQLARRDGAAIVNVGSILGSIATPGQAVYSASKFALHGFTEALRREVVDLGIAVIYVAPRATDTGMNGERAREVNARVGVAMDPPERVAEEIFRAMCRSQRERYVGWPEKLFVRINALLPGLVDRALAKQRLVLKDTRAPLGRLALGNGVKR